MREILFRGKTIFTQTENKWIYGSLAINTDGSCQIADNSDELKFWTYVDSETVGQYTGLKDKNGTKIFEGDIVRKELKIYTVEFSKERGGWFPFAVDDGCGCCSVEVEIPTRVEVIGNIHDKRGDEDEG